MELYLVGGTFIHPILDSRSYFIVSNAGLTGIGLASPTTQLDVQAFGTNDPFQVRDNTGEALLKVLANGSVGIGTASPATQLDVQAIGNNVPFQVRNNAGTTLLKVNTNGSVQVGVENRHILTEIFCFLCTGKPLPENL